MYDCFNEYTLYYSIIIIFIFETHGYLALRLLFLCLQSLYKLFLAVQCGHAGHTILLLVDQYI